MKSIETAGPNVDHTESSTQSTERKPYQAPKLADFGSFAEVTRGTNTYTGTDGSLYS